MEFSYNVVKYYGKVRLAKKKLAAIRNERRSAGNNPRQINIWADEPASGAYHE
jgi:hypothetical protein